MVDMLHVCLMGFRRDLARRILELVLSVVFLLIGATDAHLANEILSRYCCFHHYMIQLRKKQMAEMN